MRTRARRVATTGICALMLTSGHRIAAQDQRTAILNAERAAAELSRDSGFAGAILGSFHRDGILLWPGAPVVAGASDVRWLLATMQTDSLQLIWQPLGVELSRDSSLGVTWGIAVASASRNAPAPEIGSYIAAWRRDGAQWTIAALVFAGLRQLPKPALGGEIPLSRKASQAAGSRGHFVAADLAFARLAADSAYGSAENLAWLVHERGIEPHIPVFDKSQRTARVTTSPMTANGTAISARPERNSGNARKSIECRALSSMPTG